MQGQLNDELNCTSSIIPIKLNCHNCNGVSYNISTFKNSLSVRLLYLERWFIALSGFSVQFLPGMRVY